MSRIRVVIGKVAARLDAWATASAAQVNTSLHPLSPSYDPAKHDNYFQLVQSALSWTGDEAVRNVALTGSYGVGKSSILAEVVRANAGDVIQVSLSTLGFRTSASSRTATPGESVPVQDGSGGEATHEESKTNQIQKEIVKQLLYTQDPVDMPGSRYRRTTRFRPLRELAVAAVLAIPLTLVSFVVGWTAKVAALFAVPKEASLWWQLAVFAALMAFIYLVRRMLHNKIHIDSISTGAATIKLSTESDTYFDEYLDEIVYFFETDERSIVIFEDIDRFEDAHIFETLRSLNTILNSAKQLRGRRIKFIYAIKDSIFEELITGNHAPDDEVQKAAPSSDRAVLELARANRTKFFDVVIPVEPFITHQTARERLADELRDVTHEVSDELLDLAARHVADMRLLKNIRNEFVVFKREVLENSKLELNDDALLAMVLYKNTHLSDFEAIKLGTSKLDQLYLRSRELVEQHTRRLNREIVRSRRRLEQSAGLEEKGKQAGVALNRFLDTVSSFEVSRPTVQVGGSPVGRSVLEGPAFWQSLIAGDKQVVLSYNSPNTGWPRSRVFSIDEIENVIGVPLNDEEWSAADEVKEQALTEAARRDLEFLLHADMAELVTRDDLTLTVASATPMTFASLAAELGSQLAYDLIAEGFIDKYFTLYTATFVGERISANAMNYIITNIDRRKRDMHFALSRDDVTSLTRERYAALEREVSAFNVDLVDVLVNERHPLAATILKNLVRSQKVATEFIQAFVLTGRDFGPLIRTLATDWPAILSTIVSGLEIDNDLRRRLFDEALTALGDGPYEVLTETAHYLATHYHTLPTFTSRIVSVDEADRIMRLVADTEISLTSLVPLSHEMRRAAVDAEVFAITRENILLVTGDSTLVSLDDILDVSRHMYSRVISHLPRYLSLLEKGEAAVSADADFEFVLDDVAEHSPDSLGALVLRSAPSLTVSVLGKVASQAWPALAADRRFPPTFSNVRDYVLEYGVDEALSAAISDTGLIEVEAEEDIKRRVALALLDAAAPLLSATARARLIESLQLATPLGAAEVPVRTGLLVAELLRRRLVEDSLETFERLASDDWTGLEAALATSEDVVSFVSPALVPPALLPQFLASRSIPHSLKDVVLERAAEFTDGAGRVELEALGKYALDYQRPIEWETLQRMAQAHARRDLTIALLARFLRQANLSHLQSLLGLVGEPYSALIEPNGSRQKLDNVPGTVALLERLRELETVSSFQVKNDKFVVYMKKRSAT